MQFKNPFKKTAVLTGRVIKAWGHTGWGNSVRWSDYDELRVVGWLWRRPEVNDEIQFKMLNKERGEVVTRYIVTDVEYCNDPKDMFFATVKPFAYVGEPITDKYVKEAK
jgi:hypothetical protein